MWDLCLLVAVRQCDGPAMQLQCSSSIEVCVVVAVVCPNGVWHSPPRHQHALLQAAILTNNTSERL